MLTHPCHSTLASNLTPLTTDPDAELGSAYEAFLDAMLRALENAPVPEAETPAHVTTGTLVAKMLRLADATGTLARGLHPNETGPTLRALLSVYVNLKFICRHSSPEAASLRYHRHLEAIRAQMRRHVVRADRPNEGFPTMTAQAWDAEEKETRRQWKQADEWAKEHGVREMPSMAKQRTRWKFWARRRGLPTWTGLSDAALFKRVQERDAYRFYSFLSNELHGNIGGIGDVMKDLLDGRININDDGPIAAPLTLAAKYVILGVGHYRDFLSLPVSDASLQRIADDFAVALRRYPRR